MEEKNTQSVSRRTFMKTATAATAAATAAGWAKSPVFALGSPRAIGANDRITVGHIGVGGQGFAHVNLMTKNAQAWNIKSLAVADIYKKNLERTRQHIGATESNAYTDYRKLLANKDIDAVVIATPEHWHAIQAIEAIEAGKHVYLEKPMTRYPEEAFKIYDAVKKTGKKLQVGSQGCTDKKWHRVNELIQQGKVGKVLWSQASYCRQNPGGEWNYGIDEGANPDNLDWNAFLGPAPKRPFDKERFFRWRKYWDYSAGIVTDLFPHRFHPLMIATGLAWPKRVVSTGGIYQHPDRDVADTVHVLVDFDNNTTVFLAGCSANEQTPPDMIRGHKGTLHLSGSNVEMKPERIYADEVDPISERVGNGEGIDQHEANWFQSIRENKLPNCNYELATRVMVTVGMAERAYRENKCMTFDPTTMKISAS